MGREAAIDQQRALGRGKGHDIATATGEQREAVHVLHVDAGLGGRCDSGHAQQRGSRKGLRAIAQEITPGKGHYGPTGSTGQMKES